MKTKLPPSKIALRRKRLKRYLASRLERTLRRRLTTLKSRAFHEVLRGESDEVLVDFPANVFDAVVCDPPAGISFMNLKFDTFGKVATKDRVLSQDPAKNTKGRLPGYGRGVPRKIGSSTRAVHALRSSQP